MELATTAPPRNHSAPRSRSGRQKGGTRLVTRISLAIGAVGTTLALLFAAIGSPFIEEYETRRQLAHIDDLLTAVENTARIACFTGDRTLAMEVVRGLTANPAVAAVTITSRGKTLVETLPRNTNPAKSVRRVLDAPFAGMAPVGEIALTTDDAVIVSRAAEYSRFFAGLLLAEVVAVTLFVALTMLRVVVRPITQLANGLRRIEGQVDEHLPLPKGHEDNEIGGLAKAFNRMIDSAAGLVTREQYLATHDALTGLPNRSLLWDRLEHAIAQARREGRRGAVIFADLDNFKDVNDSLGHDMGDELLKLLARRMRAALRESDTVARMGGDEFVVMVEDAATNQDMDAVVQKLFEALSQPCELAGHRFYPAASLGVAVFPDDGTDADALMRNADTAMYVAKEQGRNRYRFFSPDMNDELNEWLDLSASLRQAAANGEFELHYQPKVSLKSGETAGLEALIRWRHPQRGLLSPGVFIPIAEKSGQIGAIGEWVLNEACRQTRQWLDAGIDPGRVAVNLSVAQCQGSLAEHVRYVLAAHGLPGRYLEVEITESIVMQDAEESIRAFWSLRDMGVQVAVDDFGTGYSSLSYLKRLPVDKLKIDKSFVDDIETDASDVEIIRAIIAMAHSLNLGVVAEGAENAAQVECLRAAGCDEVQGYFFSRPLSASDLTKRLSHGRFLAPSDFG